MAVYLEADTHRVHCPVHGIATAYVPWARPRARFTSAFDDMLGWLATECSQTMIAQFTRTSWRSVGRAIARVVADSERPLERLTDLRHIGIDEFSYRKRHRYLIIVVDHDTGLLVWAGEGANSATLNRFFDELGEDRCRQIKAVTREAAQWISNGVTARCPPAVQCMDPFHVVKWSTDALDQMRREEWRAMRTWRLRAAARRLRGARWALLKNEEDLTAEQADILRELRRLNEPLWRAHLLKEALRRVFTLPLAEAKAALRAWLSWAARSQIPQFVKIAKTVRAQRDAIEMTVKSEICCKRDGMRSPRHGLYAARLAWSCLSLAGGSGWMPSSARSRVNC
jgi:transposase